MLTQKGIEGGPVYALSGALREAIKKDGEAVLTLDLRPSLSEKELVARLHKPRGSQSLSTFLRKAGGLAPQAIGLVREVRPAPPNDPEALAALIKKLPLRLSAIGPIERAISSAGGLKLESLDENFMLRNRPGVFAAGEMLDWDAPTGGYLLQACFSTGLAAAKGMIGRLYKTQTGR
jgi:predicted flavoprotein YhiN